MRLSTRIGTGRETGLLGGNHLATVHAYASRLGLAPIRAMDEHYLTDHDVHLCPYLV